MIVQGGEKIYGDSYQVMEVIDKKKKPLLTVPCTLCVYVVTSCLCVSFVYLFTLFLFLVGVTLGNIMYWCFLCWIYTCTRAIHLLEKNHLQMNLAIYTKCITYIHCVRQFGRV